MSVYLYAYELQFIRQVRSCSIACTASNSHDSLEVPERQLTALPRPILTAFTFTMRCINDRCMYTPPPEILISDISHTFLKYTKVFMVCTQFA